MTTSQPMKNPNIKAHMPNTMHVPVYSNSDSTILISTGYILLFTIYSMNTHLWLSKLITAVISVFQASTLRDRYYLLEQQYELLAVAIEDIERINSHSAGPNQLIASICARVRK